ncbi:MAG: HAMP domain-containing histidine kinase [Lachnospiraceae bacterium]|nr:HAMP domain-containing histidine kinase [Lachnospiraceae bacterium]
MGLQKRLITSFLIMIIMPILLTAGVILGLTRFYTSHLEKKYNIDTTEYVFMGNSIKFPDQYSKTIYDEMTDVLHHNPEKFADLEYFRGVNTSMSYQDSYIVVRDGERILFDGSGIEDSKLYQHLPKYNATAIDINRGIYISGGFDVLVRMIDFSNETIEHGSVFIVTPAQQQSPEFRDLWFQVILSMVLVLIFTSLFLTWWIYKGIITPLQKLKEATRNIAEGNLDFTLEYDSNDDLGELVSNFEEMRVRLKASTEEKLESDKENKELISNISHDLKTPITAVKGYVEGIMDGVADTPEKMDKYIRTIYNKANEMDALINELTLYCKIDTNRIPYNFKKINVREYFEDCVDELSFDLESKNIKLSYSNSVEDGVLVIADAEQLSRVIHNIIGNSAKYIDKEIGHIDIRIKDVGDFIQVEIEDNGKGIAQKDIPYIFDRFYRTDASRNSAQGGSGIGLSIVKKIVEDHGGKIWASSKEYYGTTMYFVLRKYQEVPYEQDIDSRR